MTSSNFAASLRVVLINEGGWSDHPADPGGATNYGITQATLAAWRGHAVSKAEIRALSRPEAASIYRAMYWAKVRGDNLPSGVDLAVFDWAVNSGISRAAKALQAAVGTTQDGLIGSQTLACVRARDPSAVIRELSARRLSWLQRLTTWRTFGRGWKARVSRTEGAALAMVNIVRTAA